MIDLILVRILAYGVAGALMAVVYFSVLGWNVRLYVDPGAGWSAPLVHLVRMLVIGVAFTLCASQSALALLSSLAGFQTIRSAAVNKQRLAIERNA
jgi:F1F0 ATPase subunit 2